MAHAHPPPLTPARNASAGPQTPRKTVHVDDDNGLQLFADDALPTQLAEGVAYRVAMRANNLSQAVNGVGYDRPVPVAPRLGKRPRAGKRVQQGRQALRARLEAETGNLFGLRIGYLEQVADRPCNTRDGRRKRRTALDS